MRILVAEDNAVNQKVAQLMLKRLGQRADLATNGAEAVLALERQDYDVVLMDCQMPEMDGFEATRQIRARIPAERQPLIVAMTANALESDRQACLAAGMDDYISKPVHRHQLRAMLWSLAHTPTARAAERRRERAARDLDVAGAESADEAIDAILRDTPRVLATLDDAFARRDAAGLRRAASAMRSHSTVAGADALTAQLQQLEEIAASGSADATAELCADVRARYPRLIEELAAKLA